MARILALILIGFFAANNAGARTWYIEPDGSGDAPTIQAGVDSARAGDEVVLGPGTYTWTSQAPTGARAMVTLEPGITLRGARGAEETILRGEWQRGTVLLCRDAGDGVRIAGLTIEEGMGWYCCGDAPNFFEWGGAISAQGSRPFIEDCIFRRNTAGVGGKGAAVSLPNGGTLTRCQILDGRGLEADGGAIFCRDCVVSFCTIRNNGVGGHGGKRGGGIHASGAAISDCWIEGNTAHGAHCCGAGAGIYIERGAPSSVTRCTFVRNGAQLGGAVYTEGSCTISDCVFIANHADDGAVITSETTSVTMQRCTMIGNTSGGSILAFRQATGEVRSCIVAHNVGRSCDAPSMTFTCNDFYADSPGGGSCGSDGGGNFSADPQFCAVDPIGSSNVLLQADSPCAPGNHPSGSDCGLVGAGPVGCELVSLQRGRWGDVNPCYSRPLLEMSSKWAKPGFAPA